MSRKHSNLDSVLGEIGFVEKRERHSATVNNIIVIQKDYKFPYSVIVNEHNIKKISLLHVYKLEPVFDELGNLWPNPARKQVKFTSVSQAQEFYELLSQQKIYSFKNWFD